MPTTLFNRLKKNKNTNSIINKLTFTVVMENQGDLLKKFPAEHKFDGITLLAVLLIYGYKERLAEILQLVPTEQLSEVLQAPIAEQILQTYKFDTVNQLLQALPQGKKDLLINPFLTKPCEAYDSYAIAFLNQAVKELERFTRLEGIGEVTEFDLKGIIEKTMLKIRSEMDSGMKDSFLQLYCYQIENLIQFLFGIAIHISPEEQMKFFLSSEEKDKVYLSANLQKAFPLFLNLLYLSRISGIYTKGLVKTLLNLSKAFWFPMLNQGDGLYERQFREEIYGFFIDCLYMDPSLIPAFVECMQDLPVEIRFSFLNYGASNKQRFIIHTFLAENPYKKMLELLRGFNLTQLITLLPIHRHEYMYFLLRSAEGKAFLEPWLSAYEELENYYNSIDITAPEFHLICSLCIKNIISRLNNLFNTSPGVQVLSDEAAKEIKIALSGLDLYLKSHFGLNSRIIDCDEIMYDLGMLLEQGSKVEAYCRVIFEWHDTAKLDVFDTLKRHVPSAAVEGLSHYYKIISTSGPYLAAEFQEKALTMAIGYAEKSAELRAYKIFAEKGLSGEKASVSSISESSFFTTKRKLEERFPANTEIEAKNKVNKTDNETSTSSNHCNC